MILELTAHDLDTVEPAYIAAQRELWIQMKDILGTTRGRLLAVASSWTADHVLDAFNAQAIPADNMPYMLSIYRAMLESYLENNVQNTRYMRLFFVCDTKEPEEAVIRLMQSYGIRANNLRLPVPVPFTSVEDKFNRGAAPDGTRWALLRSEMQQVGSTGLTALHNLFAQPFPVWVTIDFDLVPRRDAIDLLRRKEGNARYTIAENTDFDQRQQANDVREAAQTLRAEVQHTGSGLHHVRVSVLVGAPDESELKSRLNLVRSASGISLERWESRIGLAADMFSTGKIAPVSGSLMTTRGLVSVLGSAMTYRRRTDSTGAMIGFDSNQSPAHLHLFDSRHPSYNALLLGQTGAGKTFAFQQIALRHLLMGCRVIMIDPQGNIDWSWLGEEMVQTVKLGTGEAQLNILDIIYEDVTNQVEHVLSVLRLLDVFNPDDPADRLAVAVLDKVLNEIYQSIWGREVAAPVLSSIESRLRLLAENESEPEDVRDTASNIAYRLIRYTTGSQSSLFAHRSNVDFSLQSPVTIFNIFDLPSPEKEGNLRAALLSILVGNTSQAIRRMRRNNVSQAPIIWFIDEMGVLMRDPVIASNTSYEFKTARARLVSMVVADQDLHSLLGRDDGYGTKHGEPMLANAAITMIFNQREGQRGEIDEKFPEIPESLRNRIYLQRLGQCVLVTPNDVMQVRIEPSEFELVMLSSRLQDKQRRGDIIAKLKESYQ